MSCFVLLIIYRENRHGSWTRAKKILGCLTIAIPKSSFHWITWLVRPPSLFLFLFVYDFLFYLLLMGIGDYADLGVLYWHLNPENYENDEELQRIREARGYNYMVLRTNSYRLFIFSVSNLS